MGCHAQIPRFAPLTGPFGSAVAAALEPPHHLDVEDRWKSAAAPLFFHGSVIPAAAMKFPEEPH
jgi:hypothetical protein